MRSDADLVTDSVQVPQLCSPEGGDTGEKQAGTCPKKLRHFFGENIPSFLYLDKNGSFSCPETRHPLRSPRAI